jgi:AraC family transcriptional regulator
MDDAGLLPVKTVDVIHKGCAMCPFPTIPSLSSEHAGWDGTAMESFTDVPAGTRDRPTWSGPTTGIVPVMEPRFLAPIEEAAHGIYVIRHGSVRLPQG